MLGQKPQGCVQEECVEDRGLKKRQRPSSMAPVSNIFLVILIMAWSDPYASYVPFASGFIPPQGRYSISRWSQVAAGSNHNTGEDSPLKTLSKRPISGRRRKESRLQVRRRVKAVLEKARIRTGVRNGSVPSSPPPPPRSTPTIVAEAASIGGLGEGSADIVFTKRDRNGSSSSAFRNEKKETMSSNSTATVSTNVSVRPINNTNILRVEDDQFELGVSTGIKSVETNTTNREDLDASTVINIKTTNGDTNTFRSSPNSFNNTASVRPRKPKDFDVIRGDIPSANAFVEPLPFKLPKLSDEQKTKLENGERVQEQSRMGREGSGYVVLDVEAPPYVVWECLLDFESYPDLIPTVKSMQLYTSTKLNTGFTSEKPVLPGTGRETRHYGTPSVTRASFVLSKFRFNIAAIHRYTPHPEGDYMIFTLDPSCTNMVLKGANGTWYTEENPDGREGFTRVYLLAGLQISRALPKFIVDYAADRAMPRATTWLRPEVEALKEELFGEEVI